MAQAYTLGSIKEIADNTFGGRTRYDFDIIGVIGKPLVHLDYETWGQAVTARTQMADIVATALLIEPLFVR
jgi:hypothetical protein